MEDRSGWASRRYHLGSGKEVFDTEVYTIYQALSVIDQRLWSGHRYTVFVDSAAAIDRVRSDSIGPGQRFAVAAIETCTRVLSRDNDVSIRWAPAHHGVLTTRGQASMRRPRPREESLTARSRTNTGEKHPVTHDEGGGGGPAPGNYPMDQCRDHVKPQRKQKPPPGKGVRRKLLRRTPKSIASRYYQINSGYAAIGLI